MKLIQVNHTNDPNKISLRQEPNANEAFAYYLKVRSPAELQECLQTIYGPAAIISGRTTSEANERIREISSIAWARTYNDYQRQSLGQPIVRAFFYYESEFNGQKDLRLSANFENYDDVEPFCIVTTNAQWILGTIHLTYFPNHKIRYKTEGGSLRRYNSRAFPLGFINSLWESGRPCVTDKQRLDLIWLSVPALSFNTPVISITEAHRFDPKTCRVR